MGNPRAERVLSWSGAEKKVLLAVAAPSEVAAVVRGLGASAAPGPVEGVWGVVPLDARFDLVQTGVGKVNAAGAVARVVDAARHAGVVSLGIAGALPGSGLKIGEVVVASASVFADEGILMPTGFRDCWGMGFPLGAYAGPAVAPDPQWVQMLSGLGSVARVATVSTCSGTDGLAAEVVRRTGAVAEAMEGAAVGHVTERVGVRFAEVRVVSNTTGDRPGQTWDIQGALRVLSDVAARL